MKKFLFAMVVIASATSVTKAQLTDAEKNLRDSNIDTLMGWNTGGVGALNLTQTAFSNWVAGGENSFASNALAGIFANYKGPNMAWDNSLDVGYGLMMQGKEGDLIKTDDKLELMSKYGRQAFGSWFYAGLLNFKTQFSPGYDYPNDSVMVSDFMAPGYLLGAIGMDYKPDNTFTFFISPVTAKVTFVNNTALANAGAFGVEPAEVDTTGAVTKAGEKVRSEFGGYIRSQFQKELVKNVVLNTKLDLFSNYLDNPGNIDVNWSAVLALKVNEYITTTISTDLIYDDDIRIPIDSDDDGVAEKSGPRIQFKEVLAVGLSYKF